MSVLVVQHEGTEVGLWVRCLDRFCWGGGEILSSSLIDEGEKTAEEEKRVGKERGYDFRGWR